MLGFICIDRDEWYCEQLADRRDIASAGLACEKAVVADAVKALRQHVHQETADELVGIERHLLVPLGTFGTVILPPEGDALVVERDQAAVGDGDTMSVSREIAQHFLGSPEGAFAVDHPFAVAQGRQKVPATNGGDCRYHGNVLIGSA